MYLRYARHEFYHRDQLIDLSLPLFAVRIDIYIGLH